MTRRRILGAGAVLAAGALGGCVMVDHRAAYAKMLAPEVQIPEIKISELRREDYRILGPVSGKACITQGADGVIRDEKNVAVGTAGPGVDLALIARGLAMYRALDSVPTADALFSPRYHEEFHSSSADNTSSCCATVTGKAIELKTDPR